MVSGEIVRLCEGVRYEHNLPVYCDLKWRKRHSVLHFLSALHHFSQELSKQNIPVNLIQFARPDEAPTAGRETIWLCLFIFG